MHSKRWLPLESNPEVLNKLIGDLGADTSQHEFVDVYGLDEDCLALVPQPVAAVLLLRPETKAAEDAKRAEDEHLRAEQSHPVNPEVYFMLQTIGNACGTIGILHAFGNNTLQIEAGSFLDRFFRETEQMSPAERGQYLENPPVGAPRMDLQHEAAGRLGSTASPELEDDVEHHYVAFVHQGGRLWELDGDRSFPMDRGTSSPETLLQDSAAYVRGLVEESNGNIEFNLLALAPATD